MRPHACFGPFPSRGDFSALLSLQHSRQGDLQLCFLHAFTFLPPWLHDHYSLHRHYGDSDSCSAPSSSRTGLLDYGACTSRHSVSSHPMHPLPALLLAPVGLGLRFALRRYRRRLGLRSWLAVPSVASGRIEFLSRGFFAPLFYGLSVDFQLLSTPCRHDAITFSYPAGSSAGEGFHPLCRHPLKRTSASLGPALQLKEFGNCAL